MKCSRCPRKCGADREAGVRGICSASREMRVARVMLHPWEEPCLTDGAGSGAIFFTGCPLRCEYCQNRTISRPYEPGGNPGETWSTARLGEEMLRLQKAGASNIDLVSPTQYADEILSALREVKSRLTIPVVWNTGGYETTETIDACRGLVDVFLTDFKYGTEETAMRYSAAPEYPGIAAAALRAMYRVTGDPVWQGDKLVRGIILRHLVLPGGRLDSAAALEAAARAVPPDRVVLSLMRQYTPGFAPAAYHELSRRVTTFEYEFVRKKALALGYNGYSQEKSSASASYTPSFAPEK